METVTTTAAAPIDDVIGRILDSRTSVDQVRKLVETTRATQGSLVSFTAWEPGDDLCPRFRFPWPPPPRFGSFLEDITKQGLPVRVFTHGIINPEALFVDIGTRRRGF